MSITNGGSQLITADGVVGTSGASIRVYSINILSAAGGAGVVQLRLGTGASGTIQIQETGNTNDGKTIEFGTIGAFFPTGCYCDIDSNTTSVLVNYVQ